jgi:curved DNA-binding protein CbpA
MTFYEELGVPPDSPPDTIRDAYRNVARLLHPDAQTNPVLKESAEAQMKRINHLYDVLSDPERRRRYDQELAEPTDRPGTLIIRAPLPVHDLARGGRGNMVWLAATAICAMFIIWLATRESSAPAVYPQPSADATAGASEPSPLRRAAAAILPKVSTDRWRDEEIVRLRAELAAANSDRERLMRQVANMEAEQRFQSVPAERRQLPRMTLPPPLNTASMSSAPLVARLPLDISIPSGLPSPPRPAPLAAAPSAVPHPEHALPAAQSVANETATVRWAGLWAYRPDPSEHKNKALFPPEFIEATISGDNGRIRGEYHARFKVGDAGISPDVNFRFEGKVSGFSGRFPWTAAGGANGEVQLRMVSGTSLEVTWSAVNLGKSMGLASGTAVLNRSN